VCVTLTYKEMKNVTMKTDEIKHYLREHMDLGDALIKRCKKVKDSKGLVIRSFSIDGGKATNAIVVTNSQDTEYLNIFRDVEVDITDSRVLKNFVNPDTQSMSAFYFAFQPAVEDGEKEDEWDFDSFIIILKKTWDKEKHWDDRDPAAGLVDDNILVQTMECVYEIVEDKETARKWLLDNGATENRAIIGQSNSGTNPNPLGNLPLAGFYFARFLSTSIFHAPTEADHVILVEKSHWDTHKSWVPRAGQSGAELTQEQNRGLPIIPFMHYVFDWENGYDWPTVKQFLEDAGATENNDLQNSIRPVEYCVAEDFIFNPLYPHEPVSQDPLSKAAYQIVEFMLTEDEDEDNEELEEMLWEKPDKFLKQVSSQSKTPLDLKAGRKIAKALNTMAAIDIVWEDFSTTWAMGVTPEGGDEHTKQIMVNEILQWATGKVTPADYGRKNNDPADYL